MNDMNEMIKAFGDAFQGSIAAAMGPYGKINGRCNRVIHWPVQCGTGWSTYYCHAFPHDDDTPHQGPNHEPLYEADVAFFDRQWELTV